MRGLQFVKCFLMREGMRPAPAHVLVTKQASEVPSWHTKAGETRAPIEPNSLPLLIRGDFLFVSIQTSKHRCMPKFVDAVPPSGY